MQLACTSVLQVHTTYLAELEPCVGSSGPFWTDVCPIIPPGEFTPASSSLLQRARPTSFQLWHTFGLNIYSWPNCLASSA